MRRGPGPGAMGTSLALHAILLVPLVVFARPPEPIEFETVALEVHLMAEEPTELPEPAPAPEEPQPEPQPEPERQPEPEPQPEPEEEAPEEPPEPEPEPDEDIEKPPETPEERPEPTEEPPDSAVGGENLDIATEGREFPFPDYLANVIVQVNRYFRWDEDTRPVGVVYFEITPDGSVRNLRMVEPSGNLRFDYAVQGAVETAGNRGAFGALPEAYAGPFLPVQLEIEPPR